MYQKENTLYALGRRDARVHDPSTIVRCGDAYYLFATGMGISSWRSRDLSHWERGPRVFADAPPLWTKDIVPNFEGHVWAPDVVRVGNDYRLYYSVSAWGKRTSAIGLATNPTLDPANPAYRWTDAGIVVQTRESDDYNAIDPSVFWDEKRRSLWLAFGSFWSGIKLIALDPRTGLRLAPETPPVPLAWNPSIEAAFLFAHERGYYLCVNWGQCCKGVNSTYEIRIGRSEKPTGPFRDRDGKELRTGGGSLLLGTEGALIGPGHAGLVRGLRGETLLSCHFYDGEKNGMPTLALLPVRWDNDGWPIIDRPSSGAPSASG